MWVTSDRAAGSTRGVSSVLMERMTVWRCSTLLCRTLESSADGVTPGSENRYTAVPGTICGCSGARRRLAKNISRVTWPCRMRSPTSRRPVRHVVIIVNTPAAMTSGNQPPAGIFRRLEVKKATSTTPKAAHSAAALPVVHPKRSRRTANRSMVVTTMVEVTATP